MYRILIVEDDAVIAREVEQGLLKWGFEARVAVDFADICGECAAFDPQLVIMDVSLPFYNGYYWCSLLRKASSVPVLFLSSHTQSADIVMAVNMGGDDYIVKPFSMDVLIAKVQALLRRSYTYGEPGKADLSGAAFDFGQGTLEKEGKRVVLTKNEGRILLLLTANRGKVVSREDIMLKLWDSDCFIDDNTLTVNMNRLRKKLAEIGVDGCVKTRKGQGYLLDDTELS